jgi:hypothetical protein
VEGEREGGREEGREGGGGGEGGRGGGREQEGREPIPGAACKALLLES